jgi:hypothetical protein
MTHKPTRKETALLRQLAQEAWEAELTAELEELFETFCRWADKSMSARHPYRIPKRGACL